MRAYRVSRFSKCIRIFCCSSGESASRALSWGMTVNGYLEDVAVGTYPPNLEKNDWNSAGGDSIEREMCQLCITNDNGVMLVDVWGFRLVVQEG